MKKSENLNLGLSIGQAMILEKQSFQKYSNSSHWRVFAKYGLSKEYVKSNLSPQEIIDICQSLEEYNEGIKIKIS